MMVDRFEIDSEGANPFDARMLEKSYNEAPHGEQLVIQFVLHVWNPRTQWSCGMFDVVEAIRMWDEKRRGVFAYWVREPFWP